MKSKFYISAVLTAIVAFGLINPRNETAAETQDLAVQHCVVNDTTNTDLNIRSAPNGKKIVGKLKNGTKVAFEIESGDGQDRSWANVWLDKDAKKKGKLLGWVLRESLDCE